jgi:hypothetical protein
MLSTTPTFEKVATQLKLSIAVLEQLHVLAQTETLALDAGDVAGLAHTVEAKEKVVSQLLELKSQLASLTCTETPWPVDPALAPLKERARYLIHRIFEVDAKNFGRLQEIRSRAVEESQKLREFQRLGKTYGAFTKSPA